MWHCPFQQKLDRQRPDEICDRRNRHRRAEAGRGIAVSGTSECRGTGSIDACDVDGTSHPCPPHLAHDAIQGTLIQKKLGAYQRRHAHGDDGTNDAVYATWRFLKTRVDGQQAKPLIVAPTPVDKHPLLKAGIIPKRLVDVFTTPPEK